MAFTEGRGPVAALRADCGPLRARLVGPGRDRSARSARCISRWLQTRCLIGRALVGRPQRPAQESRSRSRPQQSRAEPPRTGARRHATPRHAAGTPRNRTALCGLRSHRAPSREESPQRLERAKRQERHSLAERKRRCLAYDKTRTLCKPKCVHVYI